MQPFQMIAGGTFTVTVSTAVDLPLISQSPPDYIVMRNLGSSISTGWGEASDAQEIEWFWQRSMAQDTAKGIRQSSDASNPAMIASFLSADGISTYDTTNPPTFSALTATTTSQANGAVVSMVETGTIAVGDVVRMYAVTGMQQIAGYDFTVTAVTNDTSITLGYLNSAGFGAAGSAAQVLKFIPNRMYPRWRYITAITKAAQAVVTFSVAHNFTAGEIISFRVPSQFGMIQMNNLALRVLSVTASTVTLDYDSSGNTTFAFPTSAIAAAGVSPAVAVPSSSGVIPLAGSATVPQQPPGTNLLDAFDDRNTRLIHCGASMFANGTTGDVWEWKAFKYDSYNNN